MYWNRVRLVSLAFTLQFFFLATVYSQLQRATLGMVSEIRAVKNPHGLFTGDFNGDGLVDLGSYNENQVLLQLSSKDAEQWHPTPVQLGTGLNITKVIAAHCNSDKRSDLIVIDGKSTSIRVFLVLQDLLFFHRSTIQFRDEVPEVIPTDINNDGKTDLILFGKRENGIIVYTGNGYGGFSKTQILFPQRSFSSVHVTDLNDDNINDITAIDWLDNEVLIATGLGKLKFSQEVILSYDSEPRGLTTTCIDNDAIQDLLLSFSNKPEIQVLRGIGTGEFQPMQTLSPRVISDLMLTADFNMDRRDDLMLWSQELRGISVWLSGNDGKLHDGGELSGGVHPNGMVAFPYLKSDTMNVAMTDSINSTIRIMYNAHLVPVKGEDFAYAVGCSPSNVMSFDFLGNSLPDLAVLNKTSGTVSVFLNEGDGVLSGALSFPVSVKGTTINYATKGGAGGYFIVTNPYQEQLSVTEFNPTTFDNKTYTLPIPQNSKLLARTVDRNTKYVNLYLLTPEPKNNQASIIEYSQIDPTRFVEKTIISRFEPPLVTATMGDFLKRGALDIAFLGYQSGAHTLELRTIIRDESTGTAQPRLDFSMKVKVASPALLWNADLTSDGYPDVIINLQSPVNELLVSVNGIAAKFQEPKFKSRIPVNVASSSLLKVVDINGDHKMDIVLNNSLTKEIQVFWGSGNGTFTSVSRLISSEGIGGFTFADIYNDRQQELVVADSTNGWLKIIPMK